jgi:hypothetical protein
VLSPQSFLKAAPVTVAPINIDKFFPVDAIIPFRTFYKAARASLYAFHTPCAPAASDFFSSIKRVLYQQRAQNNPRTEFFGYQHAVFAYPAYTGLNGRIFKR